jgi:hypothetical protein
MLAPALPDQLVTVPVRAQDVGDVRTVAHEPTGANREFERRGRYAKGKGGQERTDVLLSALAERVDRLLRPVGNQRRHLGQHPRDYLSGYIMRLQKQFVCVMRDGVDG